MRSDFGGPCSRWLPISDGSPVVSSHTNSKAIPEMASGLAFARPRQIRGPSSCASVETASRPAGSGGRQDHSRRLHRVRGDFSSGLRAVGVLEAGRGTCRRSGIPGSRPPRWHNSPAAIRPARNVQRKAPGEPGDESRAIRIAHAGRVSRATSRAIGMSSCGSPAVWTLDPLTPRVITRTLTRSRISSCDQPVFWVIRPSS